ncbi:hypothetical protein A3C32_03635 [Candidatus Daviesbacteria bacterium RIFCSPHIGHO2_02_FULL_41_14]|uniref:Methyltransferase type 11 domain-containing protein n=1 Tax=Candidatus Gottesmanbacteria bacterium RIFCSPHIGHO2_01_FULL_47_48 TaxID=1798381 RepID=A0A1F6A3A8_9BACT|nr:MAG: Methylase involved in ubiquinone/menaquinone biosynthesis [Microgenomates group bacterium GW2011_GWA1_48_10]OGE35690.1 MAG: hypothetical protein A3C32_03635 [Candidatus Daviesbacteria bacterium RIFCSPHIGHO2_02_FULL_41_14]OGG19165.1 MAG: hypothetical protein A2721_01975 [Candidatus Gottesmanbacteria bacterium RIFCSPHIGHO2_01_FULL_47_48]
MKSDTCQNIWQTKNYYKTIASLEDFSHPGFKRAVELSKEATKILDVGCGDGSKLAKLGGIRSARAGVEISSMAVEVSRKKLPQIKFIHQTNDRLPFTENIFDIVTSFFVLEHTQNPDKMISEMIRVAKNGGLIIWLAPNFGAPNRASPNFTGSRPMKLITGIVNDLQNNNDLNWRKVSPKITSIKDFQPDLDTTVEPYLGSLVLFVKRYGEIVEASSSWDMESPQAKIFQRIIRILGSRGIFPFKYWGPHLFLVLRKQ